MTLATCPIWKGAAADIQPAGGDSQFVSSPRAGGTCTISGTACAVLNGFTDREKAKLTTWIVDQNKYGDTPLINSYVLENVRGTRAFEPWERADRLLAYFARESLQLGFPVEFELGDASTLGDKKAALPLAWSESISWKEAEFLVSYLAANGLLSVSDHGMDEGIAGDASSTRRFRAHSTKSPVESRAV